MTAAVLGFFSRPLPRYFMTSRSPLPARLIVRGDDLGTSHAANQAFLQSYTEGILTSAEIIVPAPWFPEAVRLLADAMPCDVGVHLTLSSEWENMKWRPISHAPSLVDKQGFFHSRIFPDPSSQDSSLAGCKWKLTEIEREFRAQIELALSSLSRVSHLSAHMGCTDLDQKFQDLARQLATEYGLAVDFNEADLIPIRYSGPKKAPHEKIASFIKALGNLSPGKAYLFVDHPGLDTPELRACYNSGYRDVASDRQGVTSTLTHQEVKDAIKRFGIKLISYRDLIK